MSGLRIVQDRFHHRLGLAVRFDDHFLGAPVEEELLVALPGGVQPVRSATGSIRNADGTYRFADLPAGSYSVLVSSPSGRWASLEPIAPIASPPASAVDPARVELWPTPLADTPRGLTAVRGALAGASVAGVRVEITESGQPFDGHYTRAGADGEFLILYARPAQTLDAQGRVTLRLQLNGGARNYTAVDLIDGAGTATIAGADPSFACPQGTTIRVRITT